MGNVDYVEPAVEFFISFDIVNSTMYKATHVGIWANTLREILRHIISTFETSTMGGYSFWKILGDEIIYTKPIVRISDLPVMLSEINAQMTHLNQLIANGIICDKEAAKVLGIKAAAWVCDVSSSVEYTRNVLTYYAIKDNRKQMDFAGPDIDTGFRAAKYSMKNRLLITWTLAYLLNQVMTEEEVNYGIHIISHQILDGVWGGRPYPIILFHSDKKVDFDTSIIGCVSYKERQLQAYLEGKHQQILPEGSPYRSYAQKVIVELIQKMARKQDIDNLISIIEGLQSVHYNQVRLFNKVDCTLVCCSMKSGELRFVLSKRFKEDRWSLAHSDLFLRHGMLLFYEIKDYYRDELGIKVKVLQDPRHYMDVPVVVERSQFIDDKEEQRNDIVILGEVIDDQNLAHWHYKFHMLPATEIETFEAIDEKTRSLLKDSLSTWNQYYGI